jgi:hypothetical protein
MVRVIFLLPLLFSLSGCGDDSISCTTCGSAGDGFSGAGKGDMAASTSGSMKLAPGDKRVFVTKGTYTGSAALGACQAAANAAALGGTWVGWLSTSSVNAIDKITAAGPWKLLTGETVFSNHAQLAVSVSVSLDVTEDGATLPDNVYVWTGTQGDGTVAPYTCADWTSSGSEVGTIGATADTSTDWTNYSDSDCSTSKAVYCFEN